MTTYTLTNTTVLLRGRPIVCGDWANLDAEGGAPRIKDRAPSLREALLHFCERLPAVAIANGPAGPSSRLSVRDHILLDAVARQMIDAPAVDRSLGESYEPAALTLSQRDYKAFGKLLEQYGADVFFGDVAAVVPMFEAAEKVAD